MKTYLAITLGPIYQTFLSARSTREVWGASYFFSYLAKSIILKLIDGQMKDEPDFDGKIKPVTHKFILPNISSPELFDMKSPVGLFPDNIIVEKDILGSRDFAEIRKQVLKELAAEVADAIHAPEAEVAAYLNTYLRIIDRILTVENPILDVTPVLNLAELQPYYAPVVSRNYLSEFLKTINTNGFMKKRSIERFESLVEIATVQLAGSNNYNRIRNQTLWKNSEDIDSDGEFINRLMSDQKDNFKTYHKYIAVVKVDGDKIGATLKTIKEEETIRKFSKKLLLWGLKVKDILKAWGAKAIYIGGDDLLFFAPVVNGQSRNIFELIDKIDTLFAEQNWKDVSSEIHPTLSYGVSITYYKYPLIEALETADSLLYKAKEEGGNRLAVRYLKHSGSELPFSLEKKDACFENLFAGTHADSKETRSLLSGLIHKIREAEPVFSVVGADKRLLGADESRVKNYFRNVFDEKEADLNPKNQYLEALRELMVREYGKKTDVKVANKQIFAITRTIKFMKGLDELKD